MLTEHKLGRKRSKRNAGRPSPKEEFLTRFVLLYDQKRFESEFCSEKNITSTQLYESLLEMLKANPKSFKLFENPLTKRVNLKPVENKNAYIS